MTVKTNTVHEQDYKQAAALIVSCERDLGRYLCDGEQLDLLLDRADWPRETAGAIVSGLNDFSGVGAFHLAEARARPV